MKDIQKIEEYTDSKVIFICHGSNIEEEIINDKMKLDNDVIRSSKTEGYDLDKLYKSKLYWKGNTITPKTYKTYWWYSKR